MPLFTEGWSTLRNDSVLTCDSPSPDDKPLNTTTSAYVKAE